MLFGPTTVVLDNSLTENSMLIAEHRLDGAFEHCPVPAATATVILDVQCQQLQ